MSDVKEVRYALPMDLLDAMAGYLGQRPYAEVRQIMARIERETMKIEMPIPQADEADAQP